VAEVVPTINAINAKEFKEMMDRVTPFANRVHIDICDGEFADGHTPTLSQVYVPENKVLDLHLMLKYPESQFENAVSLKPYLVIYHFESSGDIRKLIDRTQSLGVKAGIAILPETPVEATAEIIKVVDHVLIFTGHLGHNGGEFRKDQLAKVGDVRKLNGNAEISVDGGVNLDNVTSVAEAGVDVLYAGASIHQANDPARAYSLMSNVVSGVVR
jgi:ribulose-phosphate 3-epimerase